MLNEYKSICEKVADRVPDWRTRSKSDLIESYARASTFDSTLAEAYLSAIMCRYWNVIGKYYRNNSTSVTPEDVFDWLIHAIKYTVDHRDWENPYKKKLNKVTGEYEMIPNPMYHKKDAPNIILNQCMASTRMIFFQSANYDNRKINYETASLDRLYDEKEDYIIPADYSNDPNFNDYPALKDYIRKCFNDKEFIKALIIDGIINGNVFDDKKEFVGTRVFNRFDQIGRVEPGPNVYELSKEEKEATISQSDTRSMKYQTEKIFDTRSVFNKKKLVKHLKHIDNNYCNTLSKLFNLDINDVERYCELCKKASSTKIYSAIDKVLSDLKQNFDII